MIQCFNPFAEKLSLSGEKPPRIEYSCQTLESQVSIPRTMHLHKHLTEIVFILAGKGMHWIGDKKYTPGKGDIIVFNPGVIHDEVADPDHNLSVFCVGIAHLRLTARPANALLDATSPPVLPSGVREDEFNRIFTAIHHHVTQPVRFGGEILEGLLQSLVYMVLGVEADSLSGEGAAPDHTILTAVKRYIDEHFAQPLSLAGIAEEFGMSRHYLSHLFKDREGLSPMQYIIRRRIGEAQSLLIHSDKPVTAIAYDVGYNNSNHFHVAFQKIVGLSPASYRKYWVAGDGH